MAGIGSRPVRRLVPGDPVLRERDERLEALKATIGRLAHDFNNLLAPMLGYIALIREETGEKSEAGQYATAMEGAARSAEGHLETVLLAVRPNRKFSPREVNFGGLLRQEVGEWKAALSAGAKVEVKEEIGDATAVADEGQWSRAIQHLLSNARYALALGGKLEVRLREVKLSGEELQRLGVWEQEMLELVLRDDGFGMSEEVARRAFEPFFSMRLQSKAAGLGLTVVHSIAQVHGGQVLIDSALEAGTTVKIWLPKRRSEVAETGGSEGTRLRGAKVLLVEGDPVAKDLLREWLRAEGLEVHAAAGDAEVRRVFEYYRTNWSVVLADLGEESCSGAVREMFARDGERWGCVFLSNGREPALEEWVERSGRHSLLRKPFTRRALIEAVRLQAVDAGER